MIGLILWLVAGSVIVFLGIALLLNDLSQFKERTIDEVPDFLRRQDEETDRGLFDPAVDEQLRILRVPVNFRRKQRIRLDLAAKVYRCKHYRVRVLLQWGNTEWHDIHFFQTEDEYPAEALASLPILRAKGKRFCRLALLLRGKLWLLRVLLRLDRFLFLPTPNLAAQRRFLGVDMLELYQEIKAAAVVFARTYGEGQSQRLTELL